MWMTSGDNVDHKIASPESGVCERSHEIEIHIVDNLSRSQFNYHLWLKL